MKEIKSIAVIGLGLIGGSILKGLQGKCYELIGIARREETIEQALSEKLISKGGTDIKLATNADLIFVCTPINKILFTVNQLIPIVKKEAIITDAGSLKEGIIDFINTSHDPINFIGGHPMAGTENKGLEASVSNLFEGAKWVLTPSQWSNNQDLESLKFVIEQLGAKVIITQPDLHDKAVALISHFPVLMSEALFGMVENTDNQELKDIALKLAASGFRDTTRLAATNPELAIDMLFENKENVLETVQKFKNYFELLEKELVENEDNFVKIYENLREKRRTMYSSDGKNLL
jgi:arogenate dehydrogenase (NADP+)